MMKILFVGSESTPFSKTGGLADVLGSLPKALVAQGIDARVVLPKHGVTKQKFHDQLLPMTHFRVQVNSKQEYAGIEVTAKDSVTYYFVDNEYYFGYRDSLYGHYDDGERYGFFNNAVLRMLGELDYYPDIIHCNDWQTGLIPYLLKKKYSHLDKYKDIKTVYTIHNLAYQGIFSKELIHYLDVDYGHELEFDNMINFMKCGIVCADKITTVSDTYSKEILYDYFGQGLSGILKMREQDLLGIVNGIDYDDFNPKEDEKIAYNYSLYNYLKGKRTNKEALREIFYLEENNLPIVSMVSRITEAKGFDLVTDIIEDLLKQGNMQFVLLGSGDKHTEDYFHYLARTYPGQVGVYIGYSDELARKIYAGSDFFLMPSRFEPCGLAQLISLKYGTIPIVRKTGGLKDTIESYNQFTKEGTGFAFDQYDALDLKDAIERGLSIYREEPSWKQLVRRAMQEDFSFDESAKKYKKLYEGLKEE